MGSEMCIRDSEKNTLPAEATAKAATAAGIKSTTADTVTQAIDAIIAQDPHARILICGSLYFAGHVTRGNQ